MKKTFVIGKYAIDGSKKGNKIVIEAELKEKDGKPVFSASGYITHNNGIGAMCAGQCLDTMRKYVEKDNTIFNILYKMWQRHHLNDCNAGTPCQENLVKEYTKTHKYDYTEVCKFLEENNLLYDNGYKYGSAWLYRPIPADDLAVIKALLEN